MGEQDLKAKKSYGNFCQLVVGTLQASLIKGRFGGIVYLEII